MTNLPFTLCVVEKSKYMTLHMSLFLTSTGPDPGEGGSWGPVTPLPVVKHNMPPPRVKKNRPIRSKMCIRTKVNAVM